MFCMGVTSPKETTPVQVPHVYSFDHKGMVRSNGYGDDDTRFVSTVHGCNTNLDHGQTLLLEQEHRNGCCSQRARFVRPRRHRSVIPG